MILEIQRKIDDEMQTVETIGGNFYFLFDERLKRLFIKIDSNDSFSLPCKNLKYSVHGNIIFAETE